MVEAPSLPATSLSYSSYSRMFQNCTSLVEAPELPATSLNTSCYERMFSGCSSLTKAPAILPATTLDSNCYKGMFIGCTSLVEAPVLPATKLVYYCYAEMFWKCSKLSSIKVAFTSWTGGYLCVYDWLNGVSSTGTFTKLTALPEEFGTDRIPNGWTVVNLDEIKEEDTNQTVTTGLIPDDYTGELYVWQ